MNELPVSVEPGLRRLARRLTLGLFLDTVPAWAVGGLFLGGLAALFCRLFFARAAPLLPWLWLAPLVTSVPGLFVVFRRAYRREQVVALADWLSGGRGLLLTLLEVDDQTWAESPNVQRSSSFPLPRLRPWRKLAPLAPAALFLAAALWLPQRRPSPSHADLADDIAGGLSAALAELKQLKLVPPEEEQKVAEEIERIRRAADERVDASSWEAADALREKVVASMADKQDAVKWAEESLRRFTLAAQGGPAGTSDWQARAEELTDAIEKLAKSGLLAGAPPELQRRLGSGKLPADAESLRELTASLAAYLADTQGKFCELAALGKEFGRFDPAEFPLGSGSDAVVRPGQGGIDRGRADAPLTWGKESLPLDRFRAEALPPGAPRNPDDWAPLLEVAGAPNEAPVSSAPSAVRRYAGSAGQTAWRRTLAPRHQSAVKKYFAERRGGQSP